MNLRQRLFRYLTGVGIGLVLVLLAFGNRSCTDWMPNKRVLKRLSETELIVSSYARCKMDCMGLGNEEIKLLLANGDVDFKMSDTKSSPLKYRVNVQRENKSTYWMEFLAADSTSTIVEVNLDGFSANCECN
jgi:hypothetical protein